MKFCSFAAKQFESGVADVVAYIPGFDKPIFNKTWDGYTCEKLRKELESHLPVPLPCPFSFESGIYLNLCLLFSFSYPNRYTPTPIDICHINNKYKCICSSIPMDTVQLRADM